VRHVQRIHNIIVKKKTLCTVHDIVLPKKAYQAYYLSKSHNSDCTMVTVDQCFCETCALLKVISVISESVITLQQLGSFGSWLTPLCSLMRSTCLFYFCTRTIQLRCIV